MLLNRALTLNRVSIGSRNRLRTPFRRAVRLPAPFTSALVRMIITCPSCSARYPVDAASFAPAGRKVRCAKCGHTWHQAPPTDMPRPGGEGADVAGAEAGVSEPAPEPVRTAEPEVETQAEYVAPQTPLFKSHQDNHAKERGPAVDDEATTDVSPYTAHTAP